MNIKLSDEGAVKAVEKYAKKRNLDPVAAAERLLTVAIHRINATDKYAAKQRGEKVAPAKAKGPLARKSRVVKKAAAKASKSRIKVVNADEPAAPASTEA